MFIVLVYTNSSSQIDFDTLQKSSTKSMLLSAVFPSAGQIYNESYWKVPVIVGLGSYFVYNWNDANNSYLDFRTKYKQTQSLQYKNAKDFYRNERDRFAWYFFVLYVANIADAYVGAELYSFDVNENLLKQNFNNIQFKFYYNLNFKNYANTY